MSNQEDSSDGPDDDPPDQPVGDRKYLIGADCGGTKTHAVITDWNLNICSEWFSDASNPRRVGIAKATEAVADAISGARAQADVRCEEIASCCVGMAGIGQPQYHSSMKRALSTYLNIPNLVLCTDAEVALVAGLNGLPGAIAIAGTGSMVLAVNAFGQRKAVGGYGRHIGDRGSASVIASRAVHAVLELVDQQQSTGALGEILMRELGVSTPSEIRNAFFSLDGQPFDIPPSLATLVSRAATYHNDSTATRIMSEEAIELGNMVITAVKCLGMQSSRFRVSYIGGVFDANDLIVKPFTHTILTSAKSAEVGPPLFSPAVAAAKIARDSLVDFRRVA